MPMRFALPSIIAATAMLGAMPAAAQSLDCSQFGVLGSTAQGTRHSMTLLNSSDSRRTVMWMDQNARAVHMADLNVGDSASYSVASGDIFVMVDGPGNCVEMFRVTAGQTQFTATAIATGEGGD